MRYLYSLKLEYFLLLLLFLGLSDLLSSVLFFENLGSFLVSSCLLYDELHSVNSLSHSGVELDFDGVKMEVNVLPESYELGQGLVDALL